MDVNFNNDNLEILTTRARRGEISRRQFTQFAIALLGTAVVAARGTPVLAASGELVFVNWGGDATAAYDAAYGKAFTAATGIAFKQDGTGPTEGAIAAQIKSGKPSWDIVDADPFSAQSLGKQGMMVPIDYAVVDKKKFRDGFGWEFAASSYFYSNVLAYDSTKYKTAPTGMADFFDVAKFPGKRAMYKWGSGMWEAALLADGVSTTK